MPHRSSLKHVIALEPRGCALPERLGHVLIAAACLLAMAAMAAMAACGSGPTTPLTPVETTGPAPSSSAAPSVASSHPAPTATAVHHAASELDPALATARAPEVFSAKFTTTRGEFVIEVHRSWAPVGADRFYNLVRMGFFDDTRFFRAIEGFMVQFGIPGDPKVAAKWRDANLQDDPVQQSNLRGFVTFAQAGSPNSRSTQVFIAYNNHPRLDASGFAPFGKVLKGMDVLDSLYKGYGEGAPEGKGPSQDRIQNEGNAYLDAEFPKLDRILAAEVLPE
jgi:peptidyl-prolyl cis-trans isomerase A (cyclophilin A)